jgi:hypothetical protein
MLYFIAKGLTIVFVSFVGGIILEFLKEFVMGLFSGNSCNYTYTSSVNYNDPSYRSDIISWGNQRYK